MARFSEQIARAALAVETPTENRGERKDQQPKVTTKPDPFMA